MSEAPYVVITSKIERGPRKPSGERTFIYLRGSKFPAPGDLLKDYEEAQLLAKQAITKAAGVSRAALEDANHLAKIKREMDNDKKTGKLQAIAQTIESEKQSRGIVDKEVKK